MWQAKKSTQKYKNPWIEVVEDIVEDDLGNEKTFGVCRIEEGVCVLPIDTEGYVYLAKQYRYGAQKISIEGPGGAIDPGETPLDAAKRELYEELGLEPAEWIAVGFVHPLTSVISHTEHLFIAKNFSPISQAPTNEEEKIELVRKPFEEAYQMALDSKIVHAPSVALILKAKEYINK